MEKMIAMSQEQEKQLWEKLDGAAGKILFQTDPLNWAVFFVPDGSEEKHFICEGNS